MALAKMVEAILALCRIRDSRSSSPINRGEQQATACCSQIIRFSCDVRDTRMSSIGTSNNAPRAYRLSTEGRLSLLPFVDRLRLLETKVCLQVADTHPTLGAKTDDVLSSRDRINNRKLLHVHGNRLHLKSLPKRESSRILEEAQKSKSKRNFVKKLSHKEAQS